MATKIDICKLGLDAKFPIKGYAGYPILGRVPAVNFQEGRHMMIINIGI